MLARITAFSKRKGFSRKLISSCYALSSKEGGEASKTIFAGHLRAKEGGWAVGGRSVYLLTSDFESGGSASFIHEIQVVVFFYQLIKADYL